MKKNINAHLGFSIAELLITMLITMLVAAALVPVIGPKKIKHVIPKRPHGIAECYWDNGQLKYYYEDNSGKKVGPMDANGYCTFDVPKAELIDVFAIGAGSKEAAAGNFAQGQQNPNATYSGNISIDNFAGDLGYNIEQKLGADNNKNVLVPGSNMTFAEIVKDSMTRWALRINNAKSYSDQDPMVDNGTPAIGDTGMKFNNINADHRYLYAEFSKLKSPIGRPGRGMITHFFNQYRAVNYGITNCQNNCKKNSNEGCSAYRSYVFDEIAGGIEGLKSQLQDDNLDDDYRCLIRVLTRGGKSGKRREINNPVLFPIDGTSTVKMDANAFSNGPNPNGGIPLNRLEIDISTKQGSNKLTMISSGYGNFATANVGSATYPFYPIAPGPSADFTFAVGTEGDAAAEPTIDSSGSNPVLYGLSGTTSLRGNHFGLDSSDVGRIPPFFNPMDNDLNEGAMASETDGPSPGVIEFKSPAFTWQYFDGQFNLNYTSAGTHGKISSQSFKNLSGQLFLFPGKNDDSGKTNTKVTTDAEGNNKILSANSPNDTTGGGVYIIDANNPVPDDANPKNNDLDAYISKITDAGNSGFKSGLYALCTNPANPNNKVCPGYANPGTFTPIGNNSKRLVLTNNQAYSNNANYKDFKTYQRVFEDVPQNNNGCPDGYHVDNNNNACVADVKPRGNGAVIISW